MKKYISTFFVLALLSLGMAASDFVTVSNDITYTVSKSGADAWSEADGVMTSTNFTAGTTDKYIIEFTCSTPSVFSTDYQMKTTLYSHLYFSIDEERKTDYTTKSTGTYTCLIDPGTHTLEVQFYRAYSKDANCEDVTELRNMSLIGIESLVMTIPTLTPGALGVEALGLVSSLPDMKYLRIGAGNLNSTDWTTLKQMTSLEYLDIAGTDVTEIPASQFKGMVIRIIEFPTGLKSIGNEAFYNARLQGVIRLPEGLTTLGFNMFLHYEVLIYVL